MEPPPCFQVSYHLIRENCIDTSDHRDGSANFNTRSACACYIIWKKMKLDESGQNRLNRLLLPLFVCQDQLYKGLPLNVLTSCTFNPCSCSPAGGVRLPAPTAPRSPLATLVTGNCRPPPTQTAIYEQIRLPTTRSSHRRPNPAVFSPKKFTEKLVLNEW